jgi:hypothetical protein
MQYGKLGMKQITFSERKLLIRNKPRKIREYKTKNSVAISHKTLIESFTKDLFSEYELLLHRWGTPGKKRHELLKYMDKKNIIDGPMRELAEIRNNDLSVHQKILAALRHIWTNHKEYVRDLQKANPDRFWKSMATGVVAGARSRTNVDLSSTWEGKEGKKELVKFLKNLFTKQQGKCAITGIDLELETGTDRPNPNRCSLDRIDSSRGYNHRNVWLVCAWVNIMKHTMDMPEFKEKITVLYSALNNVEESINLKG